MPSVVLHSAVITLLYLCQGLATSLPGLFPVLIQESTPDFPVAKLAYMSIWAYPFTVKFLWAYLVDVYYSRSVEESVRINRRAQWVVPLQLVMASGYMLLSARGESMLEPRALDWASASEGPTNGLLGTNLSSLFMTVLVLLILGATQDVAVDAWAVEGLPESLSGLGGTLQLVGLVLGSCFTNLFLFARSSTKGNPSSFLHALPLTLDVFFGVSAALCVAGCGLSLLLSIHSGKLLAGQPNEKVQHDASDSSGQTPRRSRTPRRTKRPPAPPPAAATTTNAEATPGASQIWRLLTDQHIRDMISVMLSRGVASACNSLMQSSLLSRGILTAADVAQLRLVCTVLQVLSSILLAPRWNNRHCPGWVFRTANKLDLVLSCFAVAAFSIVVRNRDLGPYYFYGVVCPLSLAGSILGTVSFVAVVQQSTTSAKRHPEVSAAVITYLYSAANFGYLMPSSACLFSSEPIGRWLGLREPHDTASLLGFLSVGVGLLLRFVVLLPAARRMEGTSTSAAPTPSRHRRSGSATSSSDSSPALPKSKRE